MSISTAFSSLGKRGSGSFYHLSNFMKNYYDHDTSRPVEALEAETLQDMTVFNPLNKAFTHPWNGVPYTLPPHSITHHPAFLAKHLAKHLATFIFIHVDKGFVDKINAEGKRIPRGIGTKELQMMASALLNITPPVAMAGDTIEMEAPEADEAYEVMDLKDMFPKEAAAKAEEVVEEAEIAPVGEMEVPEGGFDDGELEVEEKPEEETPVYAAAPSEDTQVNPVPRRRGRQPKSE